MLKDMHTFACLMKRLYLCTCKKKNNLLRLVIQVLIMKRNYLSPTVEKFRVKTMSCLLAASPDDLPGSILGPDVGLDLDDPNNDFKED